MLEADVVEEPLRVADNPIATQKPSALDQISINNGMQALEARHGLPFCFYRNRIEPLRYSHLHQSCKHSPRHVSQQLLPLHSRNWASPSVQYSVKLFVAE